MKEILYETLNHTLSADKLIRQSAEQKLKALEVTDEFGVYLTEIIVDREAPLALRQLCCVLLKQYVHSHWCSNSERFTPPETKSQAKDAIRKLLPQGLHESIRRIRAGVAYAIAAVAHYDWPELWPNLFEILAQSLTSGNSDLVHGAMRVLVEFSHDITDKQIEYVAPILLPECLNIFVQPESYSLRTRTRAVEVFNTLEAVIHFISEVDKSAAKRLLFLHLPKFINAFSLCLREQNLAIADASLKAEILRALALIIERFPKQIKRFVPEILPTVWSLLTVYAQLYANTVVNGEADDEQTVDSDGENVGVDKLIFALIEFIEVLIEDENYAQHVVGAMPDLIYYLLIYVQICDDKVEEWTSSVEKYIEDEDEETTLCTVRAASVDLLMTLSEQYPAETSKGLCSAVNRYFKELKLIKDDVFGWKIQEACFLAMGSVSSSLLEYLASPSAGGQNEFDLNVFMQTSLLQALEYSDCVFLQAQALWFASRIASAWPQMFLQKLVDLCAKGLEPDKNAVFKVASARAFYNFGEYIQSKQANELIDPYLKSIMLNLINFGLKGGSSETIMNLSLSTLATCVEINPHLDEFSCQKVLSFSTAAMLKFSGDPIIPTHVTSIVKCLSSVPECRGIVEQKLLPTIVSILRNEQATLPIRLQSVCLDVLESMVRGGSAPLSDGLIQNAFPVVVRCMLTTDDTHTLQAGRECVRAFVSKSASQVINWTDGVNSTGISLLVQVVCRLLDPSTPELSATMVGRLVYVLLRKADQAVAPYLEQILRAVLSKMQHSELPAVHQSLLMVFAHLIHYHLEAVLRFLSSVPAPDGNSALQFVFVMWCDKQKMFFGAYDQKVSTMALCKLLMYALTTNDPTLNKIMVKDDYDPSTQSPTTGYDLRGKVSMKNTRDIPLLVKIYKLIVHELNSQLDDPALDTTLSGDADYDDSDEDTVDDSQVQTKQQTVGDILPNILADLANDLEDEDPDENEDDPDVVDDPQADIDLRRELVNFLTQFSQQPYSKEFYQYATPHELEILRKVNIQV